MSAIPVNAANSAGAIARNQRNVNTGALHGSSVETNVSGVSWSAVLAGAVVASALSLALLLLGTGLGFSAISPWSDSGVSASTINAAGIAWVIGMQVIAASMGGYLAGRLRTKWAGIHTNEVFFRDTAHGFLVWAVGVIVTASLLASAASALVGVAKSGAGAVGSAVVGAGALAASNGDTNSSAVGMSQYLVDTILRTDRRDESATASTSFASGATSSSTFSAGNSDGAVRAEVMRIMVNGLAANEMPQADKAYLSQLIAAKTGITSVAADQRIAAIIGQIKAKEIEVRAAADTARKAAAKLTLWMFIGLLLGAFCASYAATIGGRQRDNENVYA